MIITLKGADFSKNNIGPLSSWLISREIGDGARYSGPAYVTKGGTYTANVVLGSGYKVNINEVKVFMNEVELTNVVTLSEDEKTLTITITEVTGNVIIKVPTNYSAIYYMITYNYVDEQGNVLKESDVAQALEGTEMYFDKSTAAEIPGYVAVSASPTSAVIDKDTIVTYLYELFLAVVFANEDFEVGAYSANGAEVELDSRFRTIEPKKFSQEVTYYSKNLIGEANPTQLRFLTYKEDGTVDKMSDWVTTSYTIPAKTKFHMILARSVSGSVIAQPKTLTVPDGATRLYIGTLKEFKDRSHVTVNGQTYEGANFKDGRYYYGSVGAAVSTLATSSKVAGYEGYIPVTPGAEVIAKVFCSGTVPYLFANDSDVIIKAGAGTEFLAGEFSPLDFFDYEVSE